MPPKEPKSLTTKQVRRHPCVHAEGQRVPRRTGATHARSSLARGREPPGARRQPRPAVEWKTYGGDLASTRYSPLDQINKDNFSKLQIAWRLNTNVFGPRPDSLYSATPLMVGGVLYTTAGTRRAVVALNAATGEMLWMHAEDEGPRGQNAPRSGAGRGVSYWSSADGSDQRIIYVTPGYRMIALERQDRRAGPDLRQERRRRSEARERSGARPGHRRARPERHAARRRRRGGRRRGASLQRHRPKTMNNAKGYVRGFDVKTGKRLWIFHTIPEAGEFGYDTWDDGSALNERQHRRVGADERRPRARSGLRAGRDADRRLLRRQPARATRCSARASSRSTSRPASASGTTRRSITALWDYDLPCAPILFDVTMNGRRIKALAQPTKQAFLFVLESRNRRADLADRRAAGAAVHRARREDQPDPALPDQAGAVRSPGRVGIDDLIDFTPALRAEALEVIKRYQIGPLFTPPVLSNADGPLATLAGAGRRRRRELAGRLVRSRDQPSLHPLAHRRLLGGIVPADPATSDIGYVSGQARWRRSGRSGAAQR